MARLCEIERPGLGERCNFKSYEDSSPIVLASWGLGLLLQTTPSSASYVFVRTFEQPTIEIGD